MKLGRMDKWKTIPFSNDEEEEEEGVVVEEEEVCK